MKPKEIISFVLAGLIWGSSFLWIKVALQDVHVFSLVAWRLFFGAAGLLTIMKMRGRRLPRDLKTWKTIALISLISPVIPFFLIAWGETRIDSSVASILNGTVPLFTILCAHRLLHDEKITSSRFIGLVLGFAGVIVLVLHGQGAKFFLKTFFSTGPHGLWDTLGKLAVVGAAICYALSTVLLRKYLRNMPSLDLAAIILLIGDIVVWLVVAATRPQHILPSRPITWFALMWMGFLGSSLAFMLYYYLLNVWGATRAAFVNYVFPLVGVVLGIVFLKEKADWSLALGSFLIVAGVLSANIRTLSFFHLRKPPPVQN